MFQYTYKIKLIRLNLIYDSINSSIICEILIVYEHIMLNYSHLKLFTMLFLHIHNLKS